MNNNYNFRRTLSFAGILVLFIFLAGYTGYLVGEQDYRSLIFIAAIIGFVIYLILFARHTWALITFFLFLDFWYFTFGFQVTSTEIGFGLGLLFAITYSWKKSRRDYPVWFKTPSFDACRFLFAVFAVYLILHTLYNMFNPYIPGQYSFKHGVKYVFILLGPCLTFLFFIKNPQRLPLPKEYPWRIFQFACLGLLVNISIRFYQFARGGVGALESDLDEQSRFLIIPIINAAENVYSLRNLPPIIALLCVAFLTSPWIDSQSRFRRNFIRFTLLLSIVGAAVSGGRITILYLALVCITALIIRKRFAVIAGFSGILLFLLCILNALPQQILYSSPYYFQRSIQYLLIEKNEAISGTIKGSSDWRFHLFEMALNDWKASSRTFWTGRATYSYGNEDIIAARSSEDEKAVTALRRGATHNVVTDLLVVYGIIGLILYYTSILALLIFLWHLYKALNADTVSKSMALVSFLYAFYITIYSLFGGSALPIHAFWFSILTVVSTYKFSSSPEMIHSKASQNSAEAKEITPTFSF